MDRKALTREYKQARTLMGVYRVLNKANGKALVGVSVNLPAILRRHRFQLETALHQNRTLQGDWETYGPDAFEFEVLDVLQPQDRTDYDAADDLHALEELWLEKLSPFDDNGYNSRRAKVG